MKETDSFPAEDTPEACREYGKVLLGSRDPADRAAGIRSILRAYRGNDPEAAYLVASLMLEGMLRPGRGDAEECALKLLLRASRAGVVQARARLNAYCTRRYERSVGADNAGEPVRGPLVDFRGRQIRINRTGMLTPVDAVLSWDGEINRLTLSANLLFLQMEGVRDPERLEAAVLSGIMDWEGEYRVFGGQRLQVTLQLTTEERLFDSVFVIPLSEELSASMKRVSGVIGTRSRREKVDSLLNSGRSFAAVGAGKWSVRSRKFIMLQSASGCFDDFEELQHVAKHEFGHAIGLGDLYEDPGEGLGGVEKGAFPELDGYCITDKLYHLVMCDHHGPVSNNDIEMVVLAFSENKMQHYQKLKRGEPVSEALGRGN